jgi:5-methyltetrahydrofolate--homocysteine methyltransferase
MIDFEINREEAARYLGGAEIELNESMDELFSECEKELRDAASPKYLYKKINLKESGLLLGEDIKKHLEGCEYGYVICATLGSSIDRLIRTSQVSDMAKAVVLDSMASCAVESVCSEVDKLIAAENEGKYVTWRFSPGYGDYPIELQHRFLSILDAPRKIGLCSNSESLLTPSKSVTAIMGISEKPLENRRRGCAVCNMAKTCKFRKA